VKAWLSERGIAYELRDLLEDPAAADEFVRRGYLLPPVVVVDGQAVPGYRPERLDELLGEEGT
jgi:adenosylhomocysteine nucleosidase